MLWWILPSVFYILSLPSVCHSLPSSPLFHPLSNHLCVSRWTPSTWVSWSFSEQPGWSSCWDRVTPSVFCCGPLYNLSRSDILQCIFHHFDSSHKVDDNVLIFTVSSPTGSSLCLSSHCYAFLHIRHNWNAGILSLIFHKYNRLSQLLVEVKHIYSASVHLVLIHFTNVCVIKCCCCNLHGACLVHSFLTVYCILYIIWGYLHHLLK